MTKKAEDPFEELFGEPIEEPDEEEFDGLVANLPECRTDMKEDSETKLWNPLSETDEKFPFYVFMARSALMLRSRNRVKFRLTEQ